MHIVKIIDKRTFSTIPVIDGFIRTIYNIGILLKGGDFMFRKKLLTSFSSKLFLCIFSTAFLLLLVGLMILYRFSVSATTDINNQMMDKTLSITAENLEEAINECNRTAQLALAQEDIMSRLKIPFGYPSANYMSVQRALTTAVSGTSAIADICLCDDWGNVISSGSTLVTYPYTNKEECRDWLSSFPESIDGPYQSWFFLTPHPLDSTRYCFTNVREVTLLNSSLRPLMTISVSEAHIASIYAFLGNDSYIMTPTGTIISAVDKSLIGTQADEDIQESAINTQSNSIISVGNGEHYYATYLPSFGSYLIVNSTTEALNNTNAFTLFAAVLIIAVGLLFSIIWAKYISNSMTKPLKETKACIEQVRGGNMDIRCNVSQQDEIGYLCESFNHMMDSLDEQIRQRNEQQDLAKENELRLLQSQINPHLLYNSLDSALYLMTMNNTERSIEILEQMSSFFKLSLQQGNKVVTIGSAIKLVDSYLKIQNLCRMKHFRLNVIADPALYEASILHMLLQPIVENCVIHGFDGSFTDGLIEICLELEGSDVIIRITDDGMGMDELELDILRKNLISNTPPASSFALWNINQRIRMYYGEQYALQVESEYGEYTTVSLRIPCNYPERSNEHSNV